MFISVFYVVFMFFCTDIYYDGAHSMASYPPYRHFAHRFRLIETGPGVAHVVDRIIRSNHRLDASASNVR